MPAALAPSILCALCARPARCHCTPLTFALCALLTGPDEEKLQLLVEQVKQVVEQAKPAQEEAQGAVVDATVASEAAKASADEAAKVMELAPQAATAAVGLCEHNYPADLAPGDVAPPGLACMLVARTHAVRSWDRERAHVGPDAWNWDSGTGIRNWETRKSETGNI